jgi:hypothetical protein
VNAAILGALAFLFKDGQMPGWSHGVSALLLFLAGMVACDLWRRLLKQHSTLLSWWYERLRTLETAMPECSKLVTREYEELYTAPRGRGHVGLTRYETGLTWLFTALYAAFGLALLVVLTVNWL